MADVPQTLDDIIKRLRDALARVVEELKKINQKIDEGVEKGEKENPRDTFLRANLEIKQQYIDQQKVAIILQAFLAIRGILTAMLEAVAKKAAADAEKAAADAEVEKQLADAEAAKKKVDAAAEATRKKAEADADAAKSSAEADEAAAKKKADAAKAANDAKHKANVQNAELEAQKAIDAAIEGAIGKINASAESLEAMRKMKDEIVRELKKPSDAPVDVPTG